MLAKKNVDDLSQPAREFYERSKLKLSVSLFCISVAFFMIGLCSEAGGKSLASSFFMENVAGNALVLVACCFPAARSARPASLFEC